VEDWRAHHQAYITLWDMRGSSRQRYLHGARHKSGPWVEYLRWFQHQSRLFLRLAYTQDDIAEVPRASLHSSHDLSRARSSDMTLARVQDFNNA
jgi:hypothetical protein